MRRPDLLRKFQFPSNGKAYPKHANKPNGKLKAIYSFQFPSNGKAYPKLKSSWQNENNHKLCFNSLQTGKPIQSRCFEFVSSGRNYVSIPFKRESLSKAKAKNDDKGKGDEFQFPSNGKAYPKSTPKQQSKESLCFNSLQTGKPIQRSIPRLSLVLDTWFQFPSNGKAYPKIIWTTQKLMITQDSIPFKRESLSKDCRWQRREWTCHRRFNSLQTGKPIQRLLYGNHISYNKWPVSIPFKRESLSKAIGSFSSADHRR